MEKQHDLYDFFKNANDNIAREYLRIRRRANEDPGTAGDQGEENWKELFEQWLPSYFHIVTKGKIIDTLGKTGPQVDVIVLSPDYPKSLLKCKQYLAGGVVAAFECKTTLKREHICKLMENSKKIKRAAINESGTPRKDLQSKIYYGILAHSHEWKSEHSKPKNNINKAVYELDEKIITHPIEMPDMVCVADVGVWSAHKMIVLDKSNRTVMSTYIESNNDEAFFTPVGACVFDLLENIAWRYPSVKDIVSYMRKLSLSETGQGRNRQWSLGILTEETRSNLFKLKNGGVWDEWSIMI